MYDSPGVRAANDALWRHVVGQLRSAGFDHVPEQLDRERPLDAIWSDPDLLLAQTCGYPLTTRLRGQVQLVCTPVYEAPGCDGPLHSAALVVAADDRTPSLAALGGRRCAVNAADSNTGYNLLRRMIADVAKGGRFLATSPLVTGSHLESLSAVARGEADFASIDGVTLAHLRRDRPDIVERVRVLLWSRRTPGLPLITGLATPPPLISALRHALRRALRALDAPAREATLIRGFAFVPAARYDDIVEMEKQAAQLAYPVLR